MAIKPLQVHHYVFWAYSFLWGTGVDRCLCGRPSGINSLASFSIICIYSFQTLFVSFPGAQQTVKSWLEKQLSVTHHGLNLCADPLQKKNSHADENSKTSVTPRKEKSSVHDRKNQILWETTLSIFIIHSLLPYLGSLVHDVSLSDHVTNMLKSPTSFCLLSSGFIYPIVHLIFSLEHYKATSNFSRPILMIFSHSVECDSFSVMQGRTQRIFLDHSFFKCSIYPTHHQVLYTWFPKKLSRVSPHFISTATLSFYHLSLPNMSSFFQSVLHCSYASLFKILSCNYFTLCLNTFDDSPLFLR